MAVVCGKCRSSFPQEAAMIRSRTMNKIHELAVQGKSIQDIAITLGIARNTVRKYLRHPELVAMPHPRPNRRSKLDPFKEQVRRWITEDHCYNCEAMLPRLLEMGYAGSLSVLKAFVHPLRPQAFGCAPVIRYETKPGEQVQFDWGEFKYEDKGVARKLYGFSAILCYSRMRFVTFVKRCDVQTLIRCLMEAFEYFGGLPKAALTDRMKSVLLEMEEKQPRWNARFADFMASIGVAPRVCKAYTPQTKGKIERTIGVVKKNSWPSAPGPRRMSSTRTNFAMWPQLPLAGRKSFLWAICGPRQRCRRASFPSMTSSVVWRCWHAAVKTTGPHATGTGITGPL